MVPSSISSAQLDLEGAMTTASPLLDPPWSSERNSLSETTFPLDFFPFLAAKREKILLLRQSLSFLNDRSVGHVATLQPGGIHVTHRLNGPIEADSK